MLSGFDPAPQFFTEDTRLAPAAVGAYPWPPMWASVNGVLPPARMHQYLDAFYAAAAGWPQRIAGAWPGFHDYYAQAGTGPSYGFLDARGGLTLAETLGRAMASGAPLVQIATWNDFGEGTAIEPTREDGYRSLELVQEAVRAQRPLPYAAADLDLPLMVYGLRARLAGDVQAMARLDAAVRRLVDGDAAGARADLASLAATPTAEAPAFSDRLRARRLAHTDRRSRDGPADAARGRRSHARRGRRAGPTRGAPLRPLRRGRPVRPLLGRVGAPKRRLLGPPRRRS